MTWSMKTMHASINQSLDISTYPNRPLTQLTYTFRNSNSPNLTQYLAIQTQTFLTHDENQKPELKLFWLKDKNKILNSNSGV